MSLSNASFWVSAKPSISSTFQETQNPFCFPFLSIMLALDLHQSLKFIVAYLELRERIDSIKNIQKITRSHEACCVAKVRRAQAVINGRPFSETLVEVLYDINERLQFEDIDVPLTNVRPVKKVALVSITSDQGLCGGFNNGIIKKVENRITDLEKLGLDYTVVSVGKKGNSYFSCRPNFHVDKFIEAGSFPTTKEAQTIADNVFSLFLSEEVDKVELVYTKFLSLIRFSPVIHTLLPLSPKGKVVDVNGNSVDAFEDEFFRLTTKKGKLSVEWDKAKKGSKGLSPLMEFEQDPAHILDAMMPLYLNSQILRALEESKASELAARMTAMTNATDNAADLIKTLSTAYNRARQAKITGEILEIVAGAEGFRNMD
uniref:F-ATPase gamma subunit n=1 Tax=Cannabis sativa TaxID=3483 RepID=A0A803NWE5_CANSA